MSAASRVLMEVTGAAVASSSLIFKVKVEENDLGRDGERNPCVMTRHPKRRTTASLEGSIGAHRRFSRHLTDDEEEQKARGTKQVAALRPLRPASAAPSVGCWLTCWPCSAAGLLLALLALLLCCWALLYLLLGSAALLALLFCCSDAGLCCSAALLLGSAALLALLLCCSADAGLSCSAGSAALQALCKLSCEVSSLLRTTALLLLPRCFR